MKKHKSISQRLDRAKSPEAKRELLTDWSTSWEKETMELIHNLEQAIRRMDYDQLCINTGQLKTVSQKHFGALLNVFLRLIEAGTTEQAPKKFSQVQAIDEAQNKLVEEVPNVTIHAEKQPIPGICKDCGSMKFTDTEWHQLEELAIKNGCITKGGKSNVSEYIRQLALKLKEEL